MVDLVALTLGAGRDAAELARMRGFARGASGGDPARDPQRFSRSGLRAQCFNEVSYFNRCFRRRFGDAPTAFRDGRRD